MKKATRLFGLMVCLLAACAPPGYKEAVAACRELRAGMTEAQVLQIMGAPRMRGEPPAKPGQLWLHYFDGGDIAPIIVILNKSEDKYVLTQDRPCGA